MDNRSRALMALVCAAWLCSSGLSAPGQVLIPLPEPEKEGGKPLMQALNERKSTRDFSTEKLPAQVLSNLLWAAFGVNRPDGRRTAPSAVNWQEIDIYVAMEEGLYLYEAGSHQLRPVLTRDIRTETGSQAFVADAPVNLIYVADYARMKTEDAQAKVAYSNADAGFIAQNVYLYCASEGLATVVRALVDRPGLSQVMGLREDQRVVLAQTVGFPGE
jgi:SagB-type dehydrogenase family enzyme